MQKFFRTTDLGQVVMFLDSGTEFRLLDSLAGLFLVSLVLAKFVLVLAELQDSANRWIRAGRYLDKVKGVRFGYLEGFVGRHDAQHPTVRTDDANLPCANPVVLPNVVAVTIPLPVLSTWFPYHVAI